jgi:hypothetical protein
MAVSSLQMEGGLLRRGATAGTWTCRICDAHGDGGRDGFEEHYMTEHYTK